MRLAKGAEAEIQRENDKIIKSRVEKGYRHQDIDRELRQERTTDEHRLLDRAAQAGVNVPEVLEEREFELHMEFIDGDPIKEMFEERDDLWKTIGRDIGRLHGRDIIHGDLTTSNILLKDGEIYFIDFGLGYFSQRVEDRSTDLKLLRQVLESTHNPVVDEAFDAILAGYRDQYQEADDVLSRLEEAEGRGRYKG